MNLRSARVGGAGCGGGGDGVRIVIEVVGRMVPQLHEIDLIFLHQRQKKLAPEWFARGVRQPILKSVRLILRFARG